MVAAIVIVQVALRPSPPVFVLHTCWGKNRRAKYFTEYMHFQGLPDNAWNKIEELDNGQTIINQRSLLSFGIPHSTEHEEPVHLEPWFFDVFWF